MINLLLERIIETDTYTIGNLSIDGEFFCNTLEDACRIVNNDCELKIYGQTAIPEGTYRVEFILWKKYKKYYPHLIDVPCFKGILIHGGSTVKDTEGCILVGEQRSDDTIGSSQVYMDLLREKLMDEKEIQIEVI